MKKKILLVTPVLSIPGGVAHYYSTIRAALCQSQDYDIVIMEIGSRPGETFFFKLFRPLGDQVRYQLLLRRNNFALVHLNPSFDPKSFFRDGIFGKSAARRGIQTVVFFRGWSDYFERKVEKYLKKMFHFFYGDVDSFIVLSSHIEKKLKHWKISKPIYLETTVVEDSVFYKFDLDQKMKMFASPPVYKILFMSRLEKEKGILDVLRAGELVRQAGHKIYLTIAGDGELFCAIKKKIMDNPDLQNWVSLVGMIRGAEKDNLLFSHHLFCFPTYYPEGLPNVLLEAMGAGLLPITCPAAGIRDFFQDRKMGFLVEPKDPKALAKMIVETIQLPIGAKKKIIEYNRHIIESRCLASVVSTRLIRVYDSLLGGKKDIP